MSEPIPHKSHLSQIYAKPDGQFERYRKLLTDFAETYGPEYISPDLIIRSPGRVNLIGDHIDYCLFPCLPMAVENDMIIAASVTRDATVEIANTNPSFSRESFKLNVDDREKDIVDIDATKSDWVNYFKCGLVVADDHIKSVPGHVRGAGLRVMVDGNVPTGSGLSSSAAFVVCATDLVLLANDYSHVSKDLLTKLSITCEQHVGVNSGGLDQSASIFGSAGSALFVSFYPELKAEKFSFPNTNPKIAFLISNSLVVSNKHETGPVNYNLRVVEVTLGAILMAKKLGFKLPPNGNLQAGTFRDVLDLYFKNSSKKFGDDIDDSIEKLNKMIELTNELVDHREEGYTTEEIASDLGVSVEELKKQYMTTYPVRYKTLQLYKRALHVYCEAKRVLEFTKVMQSSSSLSSEQVFQQLGDLLNKSHASARDLCNNSCPELDEICEIALANGSYGSRVTGAGFGGCAVHLVPSNDAEKLKKALIEKYYKKFYPSITDAELEDALIISEPGNGTTVVDNLSLD